MLQLEDSMDISPVKENSDVREWVSMSVEEKRTEDSSIGDSSELWKGRRGGVMS